MSLEPLRGVDVDALEAAAQGDVRDAEQRDAMPTDVVNAIVEGVGRHALLPGSPRSAAWRCASRPNRNGAPVAQCAPR